MVWWFFLDAKVYTLRELSQLSQQIRKLSQLAVNSIFSRQPDISFQTVKTSPIRGEERSFESPKGFPYANIWDFVV